jgi:hypothetical protein
MSCHFVAAAYDRTTGQLGEGPVVLDDRANPNDRLGEFRGRHYRRRDSAHR